MWRRWLRCVGYASCGGRCESGRAEASWRVRRVVFGQAGAGRCGGSSSVGRAAVVSHAGSAARRGKAAARSPAVLCVDPFHVGAARQRRARWNPPRSLEPGAARRPRRARPRAQKAPASRSGRIRSWTSGVGRWRRRGVLPPIAARVATTWRRRARHDGRRIRLRVRRHRESPDACVDDVIAQGARAHRSASKRRRTSRLHR